MKNISIIGIPYDEKSSFMKGTAQAPPIIRKLLHSGASNYFAENGISIQNDLISDRGDIKIDEYFDIEKEAEKILKENNRLFTLGGDHSITYPLVKAFSKFYSPFHILHFDAHPDLYDEYEGDKYSHACPFARIMEDKLTERVVQVGIRTMNTHQKEQSERFETEIIEMKYFNLDELPKFTKPIYISLDMDAIDPAYAPGISHHEPGGLSSRQIINIIQSINVPIIGADLVEYNPVRDMNDVTAALVAKLMKEILSKMIENG